MSEWFKGDSPINEIPANDRGFRYGDGLFETIAIRDGQPRFWNHHAARLARGCERLGIDVPDNEVLRTQIASCLARTSVNTDFAVLRLVVTAGDGARGYSRAASLKPNVYIELGTTSPLPAAAYNDGVRVVRCRTGIARQRSLAGLKTLNRLEQVLGRQELDTETVYEGLMCDAEDLLICGTMSNVFIVRQEAIITPDLGRCGVAGVMRRHIIESIGIDVAVTDIEWEEIEAADEMFLCNSQFGAVPVSQCGNRQIPIGEQTRTVMNVLAENGVPECRA